MMDHAKVVARTEYTAHISKFTGGTLSYAVAHFQESLFDRKAQASTMKVLSAWVKSSPVPLELEKLSFFLGLRFLILRAD